MEYHEEIEEGLFIGRGFLENGKKEGIWHYSYETGELKSEIEYKNGIENGTLKLWHRNGTLKMITTNVNGKTNGLWQEYYENGQIKEENNVVEDKFYPINFWDSEGNQLLKNGTGKMICEFGSETLFDVYEQYFDNGEFVKEVKIQGYTYLGFTPK